MSQGMGTVIEFPLRHKALDCRRTTAADHPAQVIILPVIRIERYEEQPRGFLKASRADHGRKRKRRVSRS